MGMAARSADGVWGNSCRIHKRHLGNWLRDAENTFRNAAAGPRDGFWEHGPQTAFEDMAAGSTENPEPRKATWGKWMPDPQKTKESEWLLADPLNPGGG